MNKEGKEWGNAACNTSQTNVAITSRRIWNKHQASSKKDRYTDGFRTKILLHLRSHLQDSQHNTELTSLRVEEASLAMVLDSN